MTTMEAIHEALMEMKKADDWPEFLLLTQGELTELKAATRDYRHYSAEPSPDTLHGLPIIIYGSTQHFLLQAQGRRLVRPNA